MATSILKQYITNGYAINSEKITHQRFKELEKDVVNLKQKVNSIEKLTNSNQLEITQSIFYDGQIWDAYELINKLLKNAKNKVTLIDNYIDDTILTLFSKYENITFAIVTKTISKQLKLDTQKYNSQYSNLSFKTSNKYHDRFLVIDDTTYHLGANLKDLGKKVFAFSKMGMGVEV